MASYADQVNAKFKDDADHFVDLKDRWNNTMSLFSQTLQATIRSSLKSAIKAFEKNYPNIKSFNDPAFRLCRAQSARLSDILIDTTMQRQLDIGWVIKIITNFRSWQAMPIQVYAVPNPDGELAYYSANGLYASWDGQHTAMAFYVIAVMIMGLDPKDVVIPVVIYEVNTKAEIRSNFIQGNTEAGKKLLDDIDVYQQMVFGVRIDGANDPVWVQAEKKQKLLEDAGLFLTDEKFKDTHQVGAISRVKEITTEKLTVELVRQFCVYAKTAIGLTPRAINTKELPIILGFLKMAASDNIEYSDAEIESLAVLCNQLFSGDFDSDGPYWAQLEVAYYNWWEGYYEQVDESLRPERPRMNKDWTQGGAFFWHQLKKSWINEAGLPMTMPRLNINTPFIPSKKDLF